MMSKEKPHSVGGTAEQGNGQDFNDDNSTTSGNNSQVGGRIWQLLPEGEALAVPANELAKLAGFKNTRSLRAAIDRERKNCVIIACDDGYCRPRSGVDGAPELKKFIRRMDARCASNRMAVRSAKAALRALEKAQIDGQMEIQIGGNGDG